MSVIIILFSSSVILSVDTFYSLVASKVLDLGVNWINDISGGRRDVDMFKVIAHKGCPYVLTHSRGDSTNMNELAIYKDVVNEVIEELLLSTNIALENGIKPQQIIWDPGIGFAKNTYHNLEELSAALHS